METSNFYSNFYQKLAPQLFTELKQIRPYCGLPVYSSLDIRDSEFKVCAVDVNLFPAGFNNLSEPELEQASIRLKQFFSAKLNKTPPWNITVVPEAHTNNFGYLENLAGILKTLEKSGAKATLMWPGPEIPAPWEIKTQSGATLKYLPKASALKNADALLLNHDLSGGIPDSIKNTKLPVFPSTKLGWYRRKKSGHFEIVEKLLHLLAKKIPGFDPWYFYPQYRNLENLDLNTQQGKDFLIQSSKDFFLQLQKEYEKRNIPESPFLYIKNDSGTYGMGVLKIESLKDIDSLNSQIKRKLRVGKESVPITKLILQEGIRSAFTQSASPKSKKVSEPALYLVDGKIIGCFLRSVVFTKDGEGSGTDNLNQPGSFLERYEDTSIQTREKKISEHMQNNEVYDFLAKLHSIAAALEECPE